MPVLPNITGFSWIKQHPVTATIAAAAAAAISIAQFAYDEQEVERKKFINKLVDEEDIDRCISWSDEHGGQLTEIIENDTNIADERAVLNTSASEESCLDKTEENESNLEKSASTCLNRETSPSETGTMVDARQSDADPDTEDSDVEYQSKSPVSPQWGWYVSITPPQTTMYQKPRSSTPPPTLLSH